jgi:hypothetical protein
VRYNDRLPFTLEHTLLSAPTALTPVSIEIGPARSRHVTKIGEIDGQILGKSA